MKSRKHPKKTRPPRSADVDDMKLDEDSSEQAPKNIAPVSNLFSTDVQITPPLTDLKSLDDVRIESEMFTLSERALTQQILAKFNQNIDKKDSCFEINVVRGEQIKPGHFMLGLRNNTPELHGPSADPIARRFTYKPGKFTKKLGSVNQNKLFYGAEGSYVLNVPMGHYAKAWSDNKPILYGQGTHVIHSATFKFIEEDIVKQSKNYIEHGTIHILRVPAGYLAKIRLNNVPYILPAQKTPYIFNHPAFDMENDPYVKESESYIQHDTIHILRVPSGTIAKVSLGSHAFLLEAQKDPYIYNSPVFSLEKANKSLYFKASSRLIEHGSIKRLLPHTGEVAVTHDNGTLRVFPPPQDGQPILITSPNHSIDGFLTTGLQTKTFPSEGTKKRLLQENPQATVDEFSHEIFTTSDSLKLGVLLVVAYRIADPERALAILSNEEKILEHIENLARTDMGRAVKSCSSQQFLVSFQNQIKKADIEIKQSESNPFIPPPFMGVQDDVRHKLGEELKEYGIELVRFNIESYKIMDEGIAKEMEKQSLNTAKTNAKEGTLEANYRIGKREAEQAAEILRIQTVQQNQVITSTATAQLEAAKQQSEKEILAATAQAEAGLRNATAKAQGDLRKAEAEAKGIIIKAEADKKANEMRGEVFRNNPQLFEYEMTKINVEAFQKSNATFLLPVEMVPYITSLAGNPYTLFKTAQKHMHPKVGIIEENTVQSSVMQQQRQSNKQ
jgi:regulator of protease activity HflC (stomatin/prohibitin superfamily)